MSTVSGAFSSALDLWEKLQGTDGMDRMADAIENMTVQMQQGFQNVTAAVNMGTLVTEWMPISNTLNRIQTAQAKLQQELATLSTDTWTVRVSARSIPFESWCEGHNGKGGALDTLAQSVVQLGNLFMTGGIANNSAIGLWDQLCTAAAANKVQGFTQQTRYNLMFELMQEVFATVGALFYTRENALALYLSRRTVNPFAYQPLPSTIAQIFGNVRAPKTVWYQFAQQMATYTAPATPDGQFAMAATSSDSCTTADNSVSLEPHHVILGLGQNYSLVLMHPVTTTGNQFFASVGIQTAQITIGAEKQVMYLVGTPVEVGSGLTFTPQAQVTPFNPKAKYLPYTDLMAIQGGEPSDSMSFSYIHTSWVPAPAVHNCNQCAVVTGFKFATIGNRMGVSLQFGVLDITDPANPVLNRNDAWVAPVWSNDFFAVQGWDSWSVDIDTIDQRPAGTADYFPGTNLALAQTHQTGTGTGDRIGVALQSAWPAFAADFFQPDQAFAKSPTIASATMDAVPAAAAVA